MSFTWTDYLAVAESWRKTPLQGYEEAVYRSVISRAYYAAYRPARDFAQSEGFSHRAYRAQHRVPGGSHQVLIAYFSQSTDIKRRRLAYSLDLLRTMRTKADYDAVYLTNDMAIESYIAVVRAKQVLTLLTQI
jgi:uncharacterized protein (UPF0332 family)